jgi:molybdopterin synthase sulfur carrier subunit
MKIDLLAFGIVKEIFNRNSMQIMLPKNSTVGDLKNQLDAQFPEMKDLASYMIAVNNNYQPDESIIHSGDEIAVIPPVSGG